MDITAIWDQHHAHLRPEANHLPLPQSSYQTCSLCQGERAVTVVANLLFSNHIWQNEAEVIYCFDCDRFSLPDHNTHALIAVDAKLWFSTPTVLNIEPTTRCNFNCWYCIGRQMKQQDLSLESFETILNHFPSVKIIAIVGEGEAIMNKQFFQMVKLAKSRGLIVLSISNGSTFSESVVRQLCEHEVDYISVSIDSTNAETFAQSRCDGDLNKVLAGIAKLREYRDSHGYTHPIIGLKGTLFKHTMNELLPIVLLAKQQGVDVLESFQALNHKSTYIQFYPKDKQAWVADSELVKEEINHAQELAAQILPRAVTLASDYGIDLANEGRKNEIRPNCDQEWISCLTTGDITPCCYLKEPFDPAWNLNQFQMNEILHNTYYEKVRFTLWNGIFPRYCEGCDKTLDK
jgi:MoaA/NifB/PqqE/SkfB family radical SAM enzyme